MVTLIELHCQLYVVGILIKCTELDYTVCKNAMHVYGGKYSIYTEK